MTCTVGSRNKGNSSLLYPESEVRSIRITTNPFLAENREGEDERTEERVSESEQSDILSDSSISELSHHEELHRCSIQSSSDEEYRNRRNGSSDESVKRDVASSRLKRKGQAKQLRSGNNRMQFKASTGIRRNRYYVVVNDSLQKSAVEGQAGAPPPSIPARRHTLVKPPPVPSHRAKEEDSSRAQSSCDSDVGYLYGVVMKDKKKGKKTVPVQSSTESEEPSSSSGFGPPTSAIVSDNSSKNEAAVVEKVITPKLVRHPQATCSSAPDVPDHAPTAVEIEPVTIDNKEKKLEGEVEEKVLKVSKEKEMKEAKEIKKPEEQNPPPVPSHAPRRPVHRVNYSRTAGKLSSKPPPVPAHSDTMKLSSVTDSTDPCNKPLPPTPSRKSKESQMSKMSPSGSSTSFSNRSRSHSRPKSLSLKSTFQGGLSLVPLHLPHPHLPSASSSGRRVDSRNIDKEWEQATKGMNYNQLMEYFNNLKESSA